MEGRIGLIASDTNTSVFANNHRSSLRCPVTCGEYEVRVGERERERRRKRRGAEKRRPIKERGIHNRRRAHIS